MAGSPVIYSGHGFSPKGDKERFLLPANFRKLVTESSRGENALYLTRHETWNCLTGFGKSYYEKLHSEIDRDHEMALRGGQPFDRAARDLVFGNIVEVSYDNSGRLIIPSYLSNIVGIKDMIYFHALREVFTLWAPDVLEQQEGPQWAVAKAACASLMTSPGRARK